MEAIIGSAKSDILWWQMIIRGFIVFLIGLVAIRLGGKRMFGRFTAFDIVWWIIVGSLLSRVITADAQFIPTILTVFVLMGCHRLFAILAWRFDPFGSLIKGDNVLLVEDGKILWDNMRSSQISERDLMEALRLNGSGNDISTIKKAFLERNGNISFIQDGKEIK